MLDADVVSLSPRRFESVLEPERFAGFLRAMEDTAEALDGRCIWNLSSTAHGGGVAESLRSLLGYAAGAGIVTRWLVVEASEDFFSITKRLHNRLHGEPGEGGELGERERRVYEELLRSEALELVSRIEPGDVVVVHDPQPAGLIPELERLGASVIWRCHIGVDRPNDLTRSAWRFLLPSVAPADAYVFSRKAYAWSGLDRQRVRIVPPSIDAFSTKNQALSDEAVGSILRTAGILSGDGAGAPEFTAADGTPRRTSRRAGAVEHAPSPPDVPLVVQVSRWDALKDPVGVIRAFEAVAPATEAHLIIAGPDPDSVSDDPEQRAVFDQAARAWEDLTPTTQGRTHLVLLPMEDLEENGAIVNALQRRSDVVVQKSLAEGFGLTVAEAMWKSRPTIASRVGGIQDQIEHGRSGLLLDDPTDLSDFADLLTAVLDDGEGALHLGREAHRRVRDRFLAPRELGQMGQLVVSLLDR